MRWLAAVAIAACSSPTRPGTPVPKPAPDARALDPVPPPAATRGQACDRGDGDLAAGTCTPGLLCAPTPGGYCLSFCGAIGSACNGGVCADSRLFGNLCLATCARDADCRDGYVCDRTWNACAHPSLLLAPPAPACPQLAPPPRGAFGPSERLSSNAGPGLYDVDPAVALTPTGDLIAVYLGDRRNAERDRLAVARITADGARSFDVALASDHVQHDEPRLAVDVNGAIHAVWVGFDGTANQIAYATSRDAGRTWSKSVAVHDATDRCSATMPGCAGDPMIAIASDGAIHVAYFITAPAIRLITSRDGGATWSAAVTASTGSHGDLAVDTTGGLHLVALAGGTFEDVFGGPDRKVIYAASRDGGKTFTAPSTASAEGEPIPHHATYPSVAIDGARVHVAYPTGTDGAWDIVLATSSDSGKTWTRIKVNDDARCASHMVPTLAVDPATGAVHVAWLDNRGPAGRLAYAVCERGATTCSANQSISDRPFAAYGFVAGGGTSLGSQLGLVLDPRRRILHAVWAQPVGEGLFPVSRIFHAQAKLANATRGRRGRGSP